MKGIIKNIVFAFFVSGVLSPAMFGQEQDSVVLTYDDFIKTVITNHPIAKRLDLLDERSEAQFTLAKYYIDPKFDAQWDRKEFKGTEYYDQRDVQVKVPTLLGADFKVAYEQMDGDFLNPENDVPISGLLSAGVSIPLLRGLMYNERRKAYDEAEVIEGLNDVEKIKMFNKLVKMASVQYLNWQVAYEKRLAYQGILEQAAERLEFTKENFFSGDKPRIDTIEARANYELRLQEAIAIEVEFIRERFGTNAQLWNGDDAITLNENVVPETLSNEFGQDWIQQILIEGPELPPNHPLIRAFELKSDKLSIEQRLIRENTKPQLDLDLNPLFQFDDPDNEFNAIADNYKWGVRFQMPMFNFKQRALKQFNIIETQELRQDFMQDSINLANSIMGGFNNEFLFNDIYESSLRNIDLAEELLEAENIKFEIGDGTLFLINSRENSLIKTIIENIDSQKNLIKNRFDLLDAIQLNQEEWQNFVLEN